ncbi:MAG: signal recognition particle subunit SRP19/SEC65 family protein [Sulfolobales archaeon]
MGREIIIWIPQLDPTIPRRLGRRIARNSLPRKPSLEDVLRACERIGLKCEAEREKRYPRLWYLETPRIRIETDMKKSYVIKALTAELSKMMSRSG